jgi:hypothetical protein
MEEEYAALLANRTWDLMALSRGTRLVGFSGASLSGLVLTMMRPSVQW